MRCVAWYGGRGGGGGISDDTTKHRLLTQVHVIQCASSSHICVNAQAHTHTFSKIRSSFHFRYFSFFLRQVLYDKALSENIRLRRMTFVCAMSSVQYEYLRLQFMHSVRIQFIKYLIETILKFRMAFHCGRKTHL